MPLLHETFPDGRDRAETYPHENFLNSDVDAERNKADRFITQRFLLPRIKRHRDEHDDAAPPRADELESMETMTLDRVVDRAITKSVWVRKTITNQHEMLDARRNAIDDEPEERSARRAIASARRTQRKIDYWTAEREAVDHALSAVIDTRARVLSAVKPRRKR